MDLELERECRKASVAARQLNRLGLSKVELIESVQVYRDSGIPGPIEQTPLKS